MGTGNDTVDISSVMNGFVDLGEGTDRLSVTKTYNSTIIDKGDNTLTFDRLGVDKSNIVLGSDSDSISVSYQFTNSSAVTGDGADRMERSNPTLWRPGAI